MAFDWPLISSSWSRIRESCSSHADPFLHPALGILLNEIVTYLEIRHFFNRIRRYRLVILDPFRNPVDIAVTSPGVEHSSMRPGSRSEVCGRLDGEIVWVR
jgi:hypothetical protein